MLSGVVLLLFKENGRTELFFVTEKKTKTYIGKRAGMLSVPMETMEEGEQPEQALRRLLDEEVGTQVKDTPTFIGSTLFRRTETMIPYVLFCFTAVWDERGGDPHPQDAEDVDVAGWFPASRLDDLGDAGRRELPRIATLLE